jgi:hypothetical protein
MINLLLMKKLTLKRIIGIIAILIIGFLAVDIIINWEEAKAAFNKGFNDMNQIQVQRNNNHLK